MPNVGLFNSSGDLITKRVESCVASPDVIEIENRTLDGNYHLQTIGTGATIAEASVHLTMQQKTIFDNHKRTGAPLRVQFDGRFYVGPIRGVPTYNRIYSPQSVIFQTLFTLLVQSEGAI